VVWFSGRTSALWKTAFLERAHLVFDSEAARSAEQVRITELEQVLGRVTLENEILKKASSRLTSLSTRNER
jgi:transposase-like protein